MPTLKLNKAATGPRRKRPPVRGTGSAPRVRTAATSASPAADPGRAAAPARPRGPSPGQQDPRPGGPASRRFDDARPAGPRDAFGNPVPPPGRPPRPDLPRGERPWRDRPPVDRPPYDRPPYDRPPADRPADRRPGPDPHVRSRTPLRPSPLPADTAHPRLSKRISELGLASRREADDWIPKGWVRVDGRVVTALGTRVHPDAVITLDPRAQSEQASRVTVLLHKPLGIVSGQAEDGHEPAITLVRADTQWDGDDSGRRFDPADLRWLAPAGRLDLDSTGLLVLTQDGRVARQLIGEDSDVAKEYRVRIEPMAGRGPLDDTALALLRHGLALDGQALRPAEVDLIEPGLLRFVLREGRKRQIRRMCEAVGQQVVSLQRVRIGDVALGELPEGRWRYLRAEESFTPGGPRFR